MTGSDRELLDRLRALGSLLDAQPTGSRERPVDESAADLMNLSAMLDRARALTSSLARSDRPRRWDDVDHIVGRLALREIAGAVALLRRLQNSLATELERVDADIRTLPREIDGVEAKLLTYLLKNAERDARRDGRP